MFPGNGMCDQMRSGEKDGQDQTQKTVGDERLSWTLGWRCLKDVACTVCTLCVSFAIPSHKRRGSQPTPRLFCLFCSIALRKKER